MMNSDEIAESGIPPADLRLAMRMWATGVAVVSTRLEERQNGMTVNSLASVSIDPALICLSLQKTTRTQLMVQQSGILGVTILSTLQQEISDRFAGRYSDEQDRFAGLDTEVLVTGAPFLVGGLAYIDCRLKSTLDAGDNNLILAEVLAIKTGMAGENAEPLLYFSRGYHTLKDPPAVNSAE